MEYKILIRPEAEKDLSENLIIVLGVIHGRRSPRIVHQRTHNF